MSLKKKTISCIGCALFVMSSMLGQSPVIDSLNELLNQPHDSVFIGRVYTHLSSEVAMKDPSKALEYAHTSIQYHQKAKNQRFLPRAMLRLSFAYYMLGRYEDFQNTLLKVEPLVVEPKDQVSLYNQFGIIHDRTNLDSAGYFYRLAAEVAINENIEITIPSMLKQLAVVHARKGDLNMADSLMQLALSKCIDDRFDQRKSDILYNLCVLNSHKGDYETMSKFAFLGYQLALKTNNIHDEINFLNVLANISYEQGDTLQALEHRVAAVEKMKKSGIVPTAGYDILFEMSNDEIDVENLVEGRRLAHQLLEASTKTNYTIGQAKAHALFARAAMKERDQPLAFTSLKSALKDTASLFADAHENAIFSMALEVFMEFDKYDELETIIDQMQTNLNHNYNINSEKMMWLAKYNLYKHRKNFKSALQAHEKFHVVSIKYKNQTAQKALIDAKVKFDTQRKQFELENKEQEVQYLKKLNVEKKKQLILVVFGLFSFFGILMLYRSWRFIRSKARLQEDFARDLIQGQEDERKRLARELHDGVGQSLVLLKNQLSNDEGQSTLVGQTLSQIRSVSRGLHPFVLEKFGLTAAVENLIEEVDGHSDIFFDIEIEPIDDLVPKEKHLHIYRIIQEAITNLLKYSKSPSAQVQITKLKEQIKFVVRDFGVGMNSDNSTSMNSLGMKTMAERASIIGGQFSIKSLSNQGTAVSLSLPTTT